MNISKAIENLKAGREDCGMIPPEEYTPTIDLATEALKFIDYCRSGDFDPPFELLPGETKD